VTRASFEVSGTPGTPSCKLLLNGEEIQNAVQGLWIRGEPGQPFDVELSIPVFEFFRFESVEADVHVEDSARDLLIKLGWTPPKENP
jgi:hypothetical protein